MENQTKRKLNLLNESTCYEAVGKHDLPCQRKNCKQWINHDRGMNCILITSQRGPLTLREVGEIYDLTRMRICQIEKNVFQKIRSFID